MNAVPLVDVAAIRARAIATATREGWSRDLQSVASEAQRLAGLDREPNSTDLATLRRLLSAIGAPEVKFATLDGEAIAAPLPKTHALIPSLDIGSGAPSLIAGYGYSRKTIAAQAMALSVADGRPLWGSRHIATPGPVVHLDFEQGERLTRDRYQRLARGMGVELAGLGPKLRLASLPRTKLTDPGAEGELERLLDGCALCIIDSLRAAAPTLDENSSEVRRVLDSMAAVSDRTRCAVVFIAHARKPSHDQPNGNRTAIRGSGAIYDACSSVMVFVAEKGEPTTVSHEKARGTGVLADDFLLDVEDIGNDGDPKWGLRVVESGVAIENFDPVTDLRRRILAAIRPGDLTNVEAIRIRVQARKADVAAILGELRESGQVVVAGGVYRVT